MTYGFHVDTIRCTGCARCVTACSEHFGTPLNLSCRTVSSYEGGVWQESEDGNCRNMLFAYYLSISCLHCSHARCILSCPTKAFYKDAKTGLVTLIKQQCTGCGECVAVCPYDAIKIDPTKNQAVMCDGCMNLISQGKEPACVHACPQQALAFGDIDKLRECHGSLASIPPLPPEDYTEPNLVITAPPALMDALA